MSSIKANLLLASTVEFLPRKCNEEDWGEKKEKNKKKQQHLVV